MFDPKRHIPETPAGMHRSQPSSRCDSSGIKLGGGKSCQDGRSLAPRILRAKRDHAAVAARTGDADPEGPISSAVRIFYCYTKTALPREGLRPIPQAEKSVI